MIIILCGKSGCGKDSILKKMKTHGYVPMISYTTRPKRDNEEDGVNYHFTDKETFLKMIDDDELIEWRSYNTTLNGVEDTWYYGMKKEKLSQYKTYVTILDFNGAIELKKYYGADNCFICYIDVPDCIREERAIKRGSFDREEWNRRLEADEKDFSLEKICEIADDRVQNITTINNCIIDLISKYVDRKRTEVVEV